MRLGFRSVCSGYHERNARGCNLGGGLVFQAMGNAIKELHHWAASHDIV